MDNAVPHLASRWSFPTHNCTLIFIYLYSTIIFLRYRRNTANKERAQKNILKFNTYIITYIYFSTMITFWTFPSVPKKVEKQVPRTKCKKVNIKPILLQPNVYVSFLFRSPIKGVKIFRSTSPEKSVRNSPKQFVPKIRWMWRRKSPKRSACRSRRKFVTPSPGL